MFVSSTHFPQLLGAQEYTSPQQFEREVTRLFLPSWHCIAALGDFPREGDYITRELLGRRLLLWRAEGEVRAFHNVCSHRFSTLSDKPCGHFDGRARCQYHGWEYDCHGDAKKIPDAKNFKPLEHGMLGLRPSRTEQLGQLIFVNLADSGPSLREHLGEVGERVEPWFLGDWQYLMSFEQTSQANWKVVVENAVESYHVDMVHPTTFGTTPEDRLCAHDLHDRWTMYLENFAERDTLPAKLGKLAFWLTKVPTDHHYKHLLRYPNLMMADMGLFTFVHCVLPVSPKETHTAWRVFCNSGRAGSLRARIMWPSLSMWGRNFFPRIIAEDGAIHASVQRGLNNPVHPPGGLISAREERIFHFQRHVQAATADEGLLQTQPQ